MNSCQKRKTQGFSLVEMLVVIAVIGIIAAISVPSISKIRDGAKISAAKRNAQSLASISASANAAGAYHTIPDFVDGGGVQATIDLLTVGVTDDYTGMIFIYNISSEAAIEAEKFLDIEENNGFFRLAYNPDKSS